MRVIYLLLLIFSLAACNRNKVPDNVLPPQQMTAILWDALLADEWINNRAGTDTAFNKLDSSVLLYGQIAKAHNTTQEHLRRSMTFYQQRPDLLALIIDSLHARAAKANAPLTDTLSSQ